MGPGHQDVQGGYRGLLNAIARFACLASLASPYSTSFNDVTYDSRSMEGACGGPLSVSMTHHPYLEHPGGGNIRSGITFLMFILLLFHFTSHNFCFDCSVVGHSFHICIAILHLLE